MVDLTREAAGEAGSELIARDAQAIATNASLAVFGQVVALLAGLACTVLTIRLLPDRAAYGRFALFFMLLEVVSHFVNWPNMGLVRFGREELAHEERLGDTFCARMVIFLGCIVLVGVLLFASSAPLASYLALDLPVHRLLLAYVALNGFVLLAQGVFQTAGDFGAYASTQAGVKILNLIFLLALFVPQVVRATPGRVLLTHIGSFSIVAMGSLIALPWRKIWPARPNLRTMARVAAYSWPLLPAGLSALVVNWIDFVVIRRVAGDAAVGVYAVAYQPVVVLIALNVALMSAVQPLLVSLVLARRRDALVWYQTDALRQVGWALGMLGVILSLAAELIPPVVGGRYAAAVEPCQVLMAGVAFYMFSGFQSAYAKALDKVRSVLLVGVVLAGLNTVLDLALVPRFGISGAAVATTAAYAMSGLFYFPILNGDRRFRPERPISTYLPLLGLAPTLLMTAASLAFDGVLPRVGVALGLLFLWGALARAIGVFPRRTLEVIAGVRMPSWSRRAVATFYEVLGS